MDFNSPALLQPVFDFILAAYTTPPAPGLPPGDDPRGVFLTTVWPGRDLDGSYLNAWSPLNPGGLQAVTENISNLVNPIPNPVAAYSDSGITVESVYKDILLAQSASPQSVSAAAAFGPASFAPAPPAPPAPSAIPDIAKLVADQLRREEAENRYANAGAALFAKQAAIDHAGAAQRGTSEAERAGLEAAARASLKDLQAMPTVPLAVERIPLAKMNPPRAVAFSVASGSSSSHSIVRMLNDANNLFSATTLASAWQPGVSYHASYLSPAGFMDPASAASWPSTVIPASGNASGCEYSFAFTRVDIARPWLMSNLFYMSGWTLQGFPPGTLSSGIVPGKTGPFPLLPVSFVVVRNLIARQGGQTLFSAPGPQIVCWLNKMIPFLPPK